jgi:hypothetical protein
MWFQPNKTTTEADYFAFEVSCGGLEGYGEGSEYPNRTPIGSERHNRPCGGAFEGPLDS